MIERPRHGFITTELDPNLLSTRFGVQTNWHVITGAPCSGKTTLIDRLAEKGYRTVPETARGYYEKEMAKGRTLDEIRGSGLALERGLIEMQLRHERELRTGDVAFLDRGLPDGLAYCRLAGLNPNEILPECFCHRYASIFMLERLPVQRDRVRTEDEAVAALLDGWLVRDYRALGYPVVRVPVLPPEEWVAYVLERVPEQRVA
jgi:predicted ATPase